MRTLESRIAGGKKAAETIKKKHGADYYSRIGKIGGQLGHTGGFAYDDRTLLEKYILKVPSRAQEFGRRGGKARKGYRKQERITAQ